MSKVSIKVVVAGRTYPLNVNPNEEVRVQKAAEDINKAIKLLQDNYAVKDMQDLLAMTALQLATKTPSTSVSSAAIADYSHIEKALDTLLDDMEKL